MARSPLDEWPPLPAADAEGFRPAKEAVAAVIARTLIRRRVELGLEQTQLAKLAGVRVETISRLESGKHKPRRETIQRLEAALDLAAKAKRKKRSA
jgi:predicted transcriptional regulator